MFRIAASVLAVQVVTAHVALAQIPSAPGQLVAVGGSKLHIQCTGSGAPTVILEAGFPGSSLDWVSVQPEVAKFTRVCSYDRAGFGWSELKDSPRSTAEISQDLQQLLTNSSVAPPYVMVGHSMGGLYVRGFTQRLPETVIGMVLVDATHEDQWDFEPKQYWEGQQLGIRPQQPPVERPGSVMKILGQMWATEAWKTGEGRERDSIAATVSQAQKSSRRLPAIPLVVLSAMPEVGWNDQVSVAALKAQQLQRELAAMSPFGRWVPVAGSNHYIHLSQPAAVVEAIRQVVQAGRSMKSRPPEPSGR